MPSWLEYLSCNESDELGEEESDRLGSESGSAGIFGTVFGGLLHGIGLTSGVTFFADESCDGDGGSIFQ